VDEVRVVYRKFDGALHWHLTMRRLGDDEHGVWLGAPPGLLARRGDDPPIRAEHAYVMLFPRDVWWTAAFYAPPASNELYCDITTPPQWPHAGEVTMIDLDLDVIRDRDGGRVVLLDEDEFADHQARYSYPPDVVDRARQAAAWLRAALSDGTEPFSSRYRVWLAQVQ
jgi:uncharacterized protein